MLLAMTLDVDVGSQVEQAVTAYRAPRHALAQHEAVALEMRGDRFGPGRFGLMDARGRLARLHHVALLQQLREHAVSRLRDEVVRAAHQEARRHTWCDAR